MTATTPTVTKPSSATVGYLPQELIGHAGQSLLEETLKAFEDIRRLELRFDAISAEIRARSAAGSSAPCWPGRCLSATAAAMRMRR